MFRPHWIAVVTLLLLTVATGSASDRVAVYGRIDKVVVAANAQPPTVQLFGVFSVAIRNNANDYQPAKRGFLFYRSDADGIRSAASAAVALREWGDLSRVAGTDQIVAFGSRWESVPSVREASEPPSNADPYTTDAGVVKVGGRTDYAPVRAIVEFKR